MEIARTQGIVTNSVWNTRIMLRRLLPLIFLLAAACQSVTPSTSITEITPETITPTILIAPTPTPSDSTRLQTSMAGVRIAIDAPSGWETAITDGLLLAEHSARMNEGESGLGMLVYIFAPPDDEFAVLTGGGNFAHSVLSHVVRMPGRIGRDVAVSEPMQFRWDGYDAAYYLLSGQDAQTMVIAVAIPASADARPRLVVSNVSVPPAQGERLRAALPRLLDGLTIDGVRLSGDGLAGLPDPLPFPRRADETALLPTDAGR
jgi:hypothetical protein